MKNSTIPYGYSMQNGQTVVVAAEKDVVKRIYLDYLAGSSPDRIATALNNAGIAYRNARHWNKNTVYRVLDDARYRGTDEYPSILCAETWDAVAAKRNQNSCPYMDAEFLVIRKKMVCASCGGKLTRNWEKSKIARWECPACGMQTEGIEDAAIRYQVVAKLDAICQNHVPIQCPRQSRPIDLECIRLEREFKRMASAPAAKPSELDSLIQQITQLQYKNIDPKGCLFATEQIRLALDKLQPGQCKNKELEALFKQIVSKVILFKNGTVQLKLKNDQIL